MTTRDRSRPGRPLVVAVEGLCFAGKTTLITALASTARDADDACVVAMPEYSDLAELPPFPPADIDAVSAALHHFLVVERNRAALATASRATVALCDRSPLSLIAYEHGVRTLRIPRDPSQAIELFAAASDCGEILTPHAYIHLRTDPVTTALRQARRAPIRSHLLDPNVQADMDDIYRSYLDDVPPERRLRLNGGAPLPDTAAHARAFLQHLPYVTVPNPPSWRLLLPAVAVATTRSLR